MQIDVLDEGEQLIARPHGRLEAADGLALISAVEDRVGAGTKVVTIDLEHLDFINFGGIRAILRLARSLKGRDTGIAFINAGGEVFEALDLSGVDDMFPFSKSQTSTRGSQDENRTP